MSTPKKLQGGTDSEVTKLKALWLDTLSESQRDFWRSEFVSRQTQAELRSAIKTKLGVTLLYDSQLTRFRDWVEAQMKDDIEAERQADDLRRIEVEHPDWTEDARRKKAFDLMYNRALASGDWKMLQGAMKLDKGFMDAGLADRRVKLLEDNAARALAIIEGAKNQGGLTAETLEKIERELKLL